jgi:signal peptidase I
MNFEKMFENLSVFVPNFVSFLFLILLFIVFIKPKNLLELKKVVLEGLETIIVAVLVLFIVYVLVAFPVEVSGSSMSPNLETGDRLLVEKLTSKIDGYKRGEIVVLHPPDYDYIDYVKRIVGLPGDTVKIYNCQVFINREDTKFVLNEEIYLDKEICTLGGKSLVEGRVYTLKEGEFVVLGDNRPNSQDSRFFGIVRENRIQGKVVARFWPPDKVKLY